MKSIRVVGLMAAATAVAIFSSLIPIISPALFHRPASPASGIEYLAVWPILGLLALWLCLTAAKHAQKKGLVAIYSVILMPFAFGYPGSILLLWAACLFVRCTGPMP